MMVSFLNCHLMLLVAQFMFSRFTSSIETHNTPVSGVRYFKNSLAAMGSGLGIAMIPFCSYAADRMTKIKPADKQLEYIPSLDGLGYGKVHLCSNLID